MLTNEQVDQIKTNYIAKLQAADVRYLDSRLSCCEAMSLSKTYREARAELRKALKGDKVIFAAIQKVAFPGGVRMPSR